MYENLSLFNLLSGKLFSVFHRLTQSVKFRGYLISQFLVFGFFLVPPQGTGAPNLQML